MIRKLASSTESTRFDGNTHPHYHVRCQKCGRVDDLHDAPADMVRDGITNLSGYEILGHRLEFIGRCPQCRWRTDHDDPDVGRSQQTTYSNGPLDRNGSDV
jgi:Fe2+ or Zn2+ uptake regulation protein